MNKTININLAGLFFHIDEDAYNRLQRYLAAVKRSFQGTQGAEEIMGDIESRIAELFLEKRTNEHQVIGLYQVEEVIVVMGQPEDYEVDEQIFEEETKYQYNKRPSFTNKQLFRDTLNGYVGGVSAGMSHYLNIEVIWVRAIWVFLIITSVGWFIPIYIVFWILVPDAVTNNQRLKMMGKEVNISNIGENAQADFEPVVDGQTDAGHRNFVGQRSKRGTVQFFGSLGRFLKGILKFFYKTLGLLVFLGSSIALIGLVVTLVTICFVDVDGHNLIHFFDVVIPAQDASWLLVVAIILASGIPLLVLSILGLRMLVSNMKSVGTPSKIVLIVLWVASIIVISVIVGRIAAGQAFEANIQTVEKFQVNQTEVFQLKLDEIEDLNKSIYVNNNSYDLMEYNGEVSLRNYDISVAIAGTTDSLGRMIMIQKAKGSSYDKAKEHATEVVFDYQINETSFTAPNYVIVPKGSALSQQKTQVVIYLPVGTQVQMNSEFIDRYRSRINNDSYFMGSSDTEYYEVGLGESICVTCEKEISPTEINATTTAQDSVIRTSNNDGKWKYED
jgi:phage shock protein PspC (stress-responsive transcriptional regulator)